jgi:hypothetical protein
MYKRFSTYGICRPDAEGSPPDQPRDSTELAENDDSKLSVRDSGGEGVLDVDAYDHNRKITEFGGADGAGDEQVAYKKLLSCGFLENFRVQFFDFAHGSRRVTSRPWAADSYTKDVFESIIWSNNSITALIEHSTEFQSWLKSNTKDTSTEVHVEACSSGLKKHRFDSTVLPLARHVLRHEPIVKTSSQISSVRRGKDEGIKAEYYLLTVAGKPGMMKSTTIGMLADASDESIVVTRSADTEKADPGEIAFKIKQFIRNSDYLFVKGCRGTGRDLRTDETGRDRTRPDETGRDQTRPDEACVSSVSRLCLVCVSSVSRSVI